MALAVATDISPPGKDFKPSFTQSPSSFCSSNMSYLVVPPPPSSFTAVSGTMLTETVPESISLRYVSSIVRPSPLLFLLSLAFLLVFGSHGPSQDAYADNHYFPPPPTASVNSAPSICLS